VLKTGNCCSKKGPKMSLDTLADPSLPLWLFFETPLIVVKDKIVANIQTKKSSTGHL
jgi:hypothetical protein